eukprot:9812270-Alexandrium_andersonii.AAC.1
MLVRRRAQLPTNLYAAWPQCVPLSDQVLLEVGGAWPIVFGKGRAHVLLFQRARKPKPFGQTFATRVARFPGMASRCSQHLRLVCLALPYGIVFLVAVQCSPRSGRRAAAAGSA